LPDFAVPALVARILNEFEPGEFLAWDHLGVEGIPEALRASGWRMADSLVPGTPKGRRDHQLSYLGMVAGLTGADAGLAESGSIVLRSGPGRPRMASLIPFVHITLLPVARLYRSWPHYVAEHPAAASGVSNLVVITGPSRTGDIEQQLTLGVHGPRHLHVVLVQ
jgi:L-lactate dehydrogenase complex protein LldG